MRANDAATGAIEGIGERDHSVTAEYRIFGPPGAGKTTNLTRQIRRAVERFGPDSVLITSFSRAAAAELAGRDLPVDPDRVGTLHSHCYHALGGPRIAEANVEDWNKENPHLQITAVKKQGRLDGEESLEEDDGGTGKDGDLLLQQLNRWRGWMLPREAWPATVREFAARWQAYKQSLGLLDFADLIDACLQDVPVAPKSPAVIFTDEAQDLNRMQLSLIRKWGERANYFIVAGDDDQTVFSFTGATPDAMLDPDIPSDHKIILKQSYRVPRAVHRLADKWIRQVTRRQEKIYLPRPEDGEVHRITQGGYKSPEYFILKSATEYLERGKTVMFLAACSYMLRPVIAVLRKEGIPFHNPYRRSNGYWNPLRVGRRGSTANRILALLLAHPDLAKESRPWACGDLALWAECLQSKGILRPGAKKALQTFEAEMPVTIARLDEIFEPAALESLLAAYESGHRKLLDWWRARVAAGFHARVQFPADVAARRGPQALVETPQVVVGTIHSVKGGQADVVYLFPDLSQAGDAQFQRFGPPRDSVIRVFYVGLTRARERLYICQRETPMAVAI
ncbi:MAG TPA: ATP-dependent helicase [Bryobacteraceae bacterium]|nr:ATP-dependent helicase [Bryobacteraceae bacterium]HPQ15771.1 ATP-dependent helicase [Bryobacteraceae bacterium]